MDKELSFSAVIALAVLGTVCAFVSARWLPWALLLVIPVLVVLFYAHLAEVVDPVIQSAMFNETGASYVVVSFMSPLLVASFVAVGLYMRARHARTAR
jgi:hypothetical protein